MFKKHILGISFIIVFMFPLCIGISAFSSNNSQELSATGSLIGSDTIRASLNQGTPYDLSAFTENHENNLTRTIAINDWGVVILSDTFTISVPEGSDPEFDSFNVYFSKDIIDSVNFQSIKIINSSTPVEASPELMEPVLANTFGTFHFNFNASTSNVTLSVVFSVTDSITKNKETLGNLGDSIYPYKFTGESLFYPWYDFPITTYDLIAGVNGKVGRIGIINSTIIPKPGTVSGEYKTIQGISSTEWAHYTINEINTINQNNLTANYPGVNKSFIPAFNESLQSQMTQDLIFDVFFEASLLEFTKVESTLIIDTWGSLTRTEKITLKNEGVSDAQVSGPKEVTGSNTNIPIVLFYPTGLQNMSGLSARDDFGNLSKTNFDFRPNEVGYSENITAIRVVPRITITSGDTYSFTVRYKINNKVALKERGGILTPSWDLSTPIMPIFNWTIRELTLNIIFPVYSSYTIEDNIKNNWFPNTIESTSSTSPFALDVIGFGKPTLKLTFKDLSYLRNVDLNIHFSMPPFIGSFIQPLLFIFFFLAIGLIFILIRNFSFRFSTVISSTIEKESVPFELVEGFVRFYQEKTAIRQRINDLDTKKSRLKKGDFEKQKQTLESKAANTDRDLMKFTQSLSDKGGRYREAVRQIEIAEATRDDILRNITDLNKKKRQKRIRPEIHARLLDDYTKKLKKSNSTIERVLVDLRSLLTEKTS